MAKANIESVNGRAKLVARREPYWQRINPRCYLGYRTMSAGKPGTWVARYRDDATTAKPSKALGDFTEHPEHKRFDLARAAAAKWFEHLGKGGSAKAHTVAEAITAYVAHLTDEKGAKPAADAQSRLARLVPIGGKLSGVETDKLTPGNINAWRKALMQSEKSKSTINRDMSALRAALNHAHRFGWVTSDHAWRHPLRPTDAAENRRDVYLTLDQRKALVVNCPADLAALVRCLCLLPLRPGAAAALTVGSFDPQQCTLKVGADKAGKDRKIGIPSAVVEFLKQQAKNKLPSAPLFTRADGRPWDKDMWKHPIKAAAEAAELPAGTVLYSLRHSTITDLMTGGLDPLTVARLSGTSIAMIQKHYGHLTDERARDALAGLAM